MTFKHFLTTHAEGRKHFVVETGDDHVIRVRRPGSDHVILQFTCDSAVFLHDTRPDEKTDVVTEPHAILLKRSDTKRWYYIGVYIARFKRKVCVVDTASHFDSEDCVMDVIRTTDDFLVLGHFMHVTPLGTMPPCTTERALEILSAEEPDEVLTEVEAQHRRYAAHCDLPRPTLEHMFEKMTENGDDTTLPVYKRPTSFRTNYNWCHEHTVIIHEDKRVEIKQWIVERNKDAEDTWNEREGDTVLDLVYKRLWVMHDTRPLGNRYHATSPHAVLIELDNHVYYYVNQTVQRISAGSAVTHVWNLMGNNGVPYDSIMTLEHAMTLGGDFEVQPRYKLPWGFRREDDMFYHFNFCMDDDQTQYPTYHLTGREPSMMQIEDANIITD